MESRFVDADGTRVHYLEGGEGHPLVLLHGGTESVADGPGPTHGWVAYYPRLAERFSLLAIDSRGHGATVNPAGALSFPEMARDVIGTCRAMGLERAVFWGFSDGANVALEIGLQAPDLVGALVVHDAVVEFSDIYMAGVLRFFGTTAPGRRPDPDEIGNRLAPLVPMWQIAHAAQGADHWRRLVVDIEPLWTTALHYTDADLKRVQVPTLVVTGDRVRVLPLAESIRLYQRLPTSELVVFPGMDHARPTNPGPYVGLVEDFLARHAVI